MWVIEKETLIYYYFKMTNLMPAQTNNDSQYLIVQGIDHDAQSIFYFDESNETRRGRLRK